MAIQEDFALRPAPPIVVTLELEPMVMIMWEASPPIGLRWVVLPESHPEPIKTSNTWPSPLSSRTARHLFPSAFRVNVTPGPLTLLPLSSLSPTALPVEPAAVVRGADELPDERSADETRAAVVGDPAVNAGPADVVPVPAAVDVPPEVEGVCGAAVCGAGLALGAPPFRDAALVDGWVTGVAAAVVGVVVLLVSGLTRPAPDATGVVVVVVMAALICCNTSSDGFEPPVPVPGAVVAGACAAVVGAAVVVGAVAGATVVGVLAVAPLLEVP